MNILSGFPMKSIYPSFTEMIPVLSSKKQFKLIWNEMKIRNDTFKSLIKNEMEKGNL